MICDSAMVSSAVHDFSSGIFAAAPSVVGIAVTLAVVSLAVGFLGWVVKSLVTGGGHPRD